MISWLTLQTRDQIIVAVAIRHLVSVSRGKSQNLKRWLDKKVHILQYKPFWLVGGANTRGVNDTLSTTCPVFLETKLDGPCEETEVLLSKSMFVQISIIQ